MNDGSAIELDSDEQDACSKRVISSMRTRQPPTCGTRDLMSMDGFLPLKIVAVGGIVG